MADTEQQEVLIVTGMSGAGRSTVANALEDLDWYVVDNLPPQMLRPLIELANRAESGLPRIASSRPWVKTWPPTVIVALPVPLKRTNSTGWYQLPFEPAGCRPSAANWVLT